MAITPGDDLKTAVQPIPLGPLFDPQSGKLTLTGTGFFDANRLQAGEILSGVNRNRANIVQLETDYTAADGAISSAYISADAVVAADAAGALAVVSSEITAARDGEVSLTAKISSVETAFASGDSANASSITTLEAKVRGLTLPERVSIAADFAQSFSPAPTSGLTSGSNVDVSGEGTVRQFTTSIPVTNREPMTLINGQSYRVTARTRVTVDGTDNKQVVGFAVYNSAGTYLGAVSYAFSSGTFTVADGWQDRYKDVTYATIIASYPSAAFLRGICWGGRNTAAGVSGATWQIAHLRTGNHTLSAQVSQIAEAYATDSGSTARLVWTVATGTNVATIEQTAAEGYADGTWNGSAISLTADEISLRADALNLGAGTTFESTHDTFYTISGSYRYRYGGPFGTSSNLLQWFGLNSVALNSETKTNGVFAMATDGKVYFGSVVANGLKGANASSLYALGFAAGAGSGTAGPITITPVGGSGFTYAWTKIGGGALSATAATSATTSFSGTPGVGNLIEATFVCVVTETATGLKASVTVGAGVQSI